MILSFPFIIRCISPSPFFNCFRTRVICFAFLLVLPFLSLLVFCSGFRDGFVYSENGDGFSWRLDLNRCNWLWQCWSWILWTFEAVARLPSRSVYVFLFGFKSTAGHYNFMAQYRNIDSEMTGDRKVEIKVRYRTLNLIRVRIEHFQFNDDLSQLASRLNEYGPVSRISWDT